MPDPLSSPAAYQAFVYALPSQRASIRRSTLVYVSSGALFGRTEGMVVFRGDVVLCVQEYLNFELGIIEGYGFTTGHFLVVLRNGHPLRDTTHFLICS